MGHPFCGKWFARSLGHRCRTEALGQGIHSKKYSDNYIIQELKIPFIHILIFPIFLLVKRAGPGICRSHGASAVFTP